MTIAISLNGRIGPAFALDVAVKLPSTGLTALLGPSGSGKTTILRALAGLQRVAGTIIIDGDLWQNDKSFVPPERRRVGYVFQGAGLLPHLSVAANLAYAARRAPSGPFALDLIIDRTGIGGLLDRAPGTLSGGEAQRAGIARALLGQPRLLLMDEPLSAIDSEARADLIDWIQSLLAEIAIPVVYVTHDHAEAARLANRTIRLRNGRLEA